MNARHAIIATLALASFRVVAEGAFDNYLALNEPFISGANCEFKDTSGVVFRSNWMKRHWVKVSRKLLELNNEARMTERGWFQTLSSPSVSVSLNLRRTKERGETVEMSGEIAITSNGKVQKFQVSGSCGA